jgi:hypothetical protein
MRPRIRRLPYRGEREMIYPMPAAKPIITTPAAKYGPTDLYGHCEREDCRAKARVSCEICDGHFCRTHAEHQSHVDR